MEKTVEIYEDQPSPRRHRTWAFFLTLFLSIVAAVGLWMYVIAENNTVTGIKVNIVGGERLQASSLTVSSIEPSSVDLVLRGKRDVIDQINKELEAYAKTGNLPAGGLLVKANAPLFSQDGTAGVFASESDARTGTFTVPLDIHLPEGVTCQTKSVNVTVSEVSRKTFRTDSESVRIVNSNYSYANGYSCYSEDISEEKLTVSGDKETVSKIAYVTLTIDWLKEITGDVRSGLVPVARDAEGNVLQSEFLSFEPSTLTINIHVNKTKSISLALQIPTGGEVCRLSTDTLVLTGPASVIDRLSDIYILLANSDATFPDSYSLTVEMIAGSDAVLEFGADRFEIEGASYGVFRVDVLKAPEKFEKTVILPASSVAYAGIVPGLSYTCGEGVEVTVLCAPDAPDPQPSDFVCTVDVSGMEPAESRSTVPSVALKSPVGQNGYALYTVGSVSPVSVTADSIDASEEG